MKTFCRLILSFVLRASFFIWIFFICSGISKGNIYKSRINAQWSEDNSHFWYRNDLAKGQREFVLVDMTNGIRRLAFDHKKLDAPKPHKMTPSAVLEGKVWLYRRSFHQQGVMLASDDHPEVKHKRLWRLKRPMCVKIVRSQRSQIKEPTAQLSTITS